MWNRLGHLPDNIISDLNDYYNRRKDDFDVKDRWNVKAVRTIELKLVDDPIILECNFELFELIGNPLLSPRTSYILEYYENSFTNMHIDRVEDSEYDSLTTVTLLHRSEDLEGGDALFMDNKHENPLDNPITVLKQEVGEVVSYSDGELHGVSKVLKGTRRVLINWWGQDK